MMNFTRLVTILFWVASFLSVRAQINTPSTATHPFGSRIELYPSPYDYGIIPTNLPSGTYNPASNQYGKSQDAYNAYNTWKSNYAENCGGGQWRIRFDDASRTVSEGIGYGMLLAAYAADKTLFDGLWTYYKAKSTGGRGLMGWNVAGCGGVIDPGAATDADFDAAMALLVAECQWPSNSPDYGSEATNLITAIKDYEMHPSSYQAINGDGWGFGNNCRNPSYQAPAYYRLYADHVPSQASFWNNAVTASYSLLNANRNTTTGLVSNWSDPSGTPNSCNGPQNYGYDACRNPWRMAHEVLWFGTSTAQNNFCDPIAAYISSKGASNVGGPVNQDGSNAGSSHNATFVSTYAAGVMGASSSYQSLMNSMYSETVSTVDGLPAYFGNTLRVLSLFMMTGNFWKPCPPSTPPSISVALTAPTNGSEWYEGDNITLSATASTTNGSITKVEFYVDGDYVCEDATAPYSCTWDNADPGQHSITAMAYNSAAENGSSVPVSINVIKAVRKTNTAPVINGTAEALWDSYDAEDLENAIQGTISSGADLSPNYKALWDDNYFYLLVNVTDDAKVNNGGTDTYNDDAIEVYFDIGNDKASTYGSSDFQYVFRYNDAVVTETHGGSTTGVGFSQAVSGSGYVMEMRFPWSTLGLGSAPAVNTLIGFDVHVNDDDDNGNRDGKLSWNASADEAWQNPSYMGTIILKDVLPLPVTFVSFTGLRAENNKVLLSWSTSEEMNNSHFEIERSEDGVHFSSIGSVTGKGFSETHTDYSFTDDHSPLVLAYYRLKQVDTDGAFAYSSSIAIQGMEAIQLNIFPNPFDSDLTINLEGTQVMYSLELYDSKGKLVFRRNDLTGTFSFNPGLEKGIYLLRVYSDTFTETKTVICGN